MPHHKHHSPRLRSTHSTSEQESKSHGSVASSDSDTDSDSQKSDDSLRRRSGKEESGSDSDTESTSSSDEDEEKGKRKHRHRHHDSSTADQKQQRMLLIGCGIIAVLMLAVAMWIRMKDESTDPIPSTSNPAGGGSGSSATSKSVFSSASKSPSSSSGSSKSTSPPSPSSNSKTPNLPPSPSPSPSKPVGDPSPTSPAPEPEGTNGGPYKMVQEMKGDSFFDEWTFWDQTDPTHGAVNYLSQDAAKAANLISTSSTSAIMKVDNTSTLDSGKFRDSVRIHSKTPMKIGSIVIADIIKMPFGCSTWPAWWTHGPDWPNGGEIDIIEGVHNQPENAITLHVSDSDCKQDLSVEITGKAIPANDDCNANVKSNQGCSFEEVAENSYGEPFNKAGGGVIVTSFTKDSIDVWFWERANIPDNIKDNSPDSATWGKPSARWPTSSCEISKYFGDQTMIFDTTLCGDWAGAESVWKDNCADVAPTCLDAIKDPTLFDNAYWEVGYVRVYEIG